MDKEEFFRILEKIIEDETIKKIKYVYFNKFKEYKKTYIKGLCFVGCFGDEIWIEKSLSQEEKDITLIHEILEAYYNNTCQIAHSGLEKESQEIYKKFKNDESSLKYLRSLDSSLD